MGKPLPKTILKPRSVGESISKPNEQSQSRSIVHLGDGVCWDLEKAANPHMVILGTSGSGKTQTLKAIVWEMFRGFQTRSIVLDFHGDQQLPGEICYPIHMASAHGINPLTINLDPEGGGSKLQAISVAATLRRALVMGTNQEGLLILMIQELYEQFGITQENRQSWVQNIPHLGDLQDAIDCRVEGGCKDAKALQIKLVATFQYGVFSRPQIDLSAGKLVRVDSIRLRSLTAPLGMMLLFRDDYLDIQILWHFLRYLGYQIRFHQLPLFLIPPKKLLEFLLLPGDALPNGIIDTLLVLRFFVWLP
jgi:Helicase HerA, central domain